MEDYLDKKVVAVVGVSTAVCGLIAYLYYRRTYNLSNEGQNESDLPESQEELVTKSQENESSFSEVS